MLKGEGAIDIKKLFKNLDNYLKNKKYYLSRKLCNKYFKNAK